MVKFTSHALLTFLFAGIASQGADAFAPLKTKSHASSLKIVSLCSLKIDDFQL
jgi:hypothetical protein